MRSFLHSNARDGDDLDMKKIEEERQAEKRAKKAIAKIELMKFKR